MFAQASRTWVSGVGDDANPCSRTAPCKTFAGAISKTAVDGEISVLDPGGFGTVTITKAMRIDGHSFVSSILSTGVQGVIINATTSCGSCRVELSNIEINGNATGTNGVNVLAASGGVVINGVEIMNFATNGITVQTGTNVAVINSQIYGIPAGNGILGSTASGTAKIVVDKSFIGSCATGIHTSTGTIATVANSTVSNMSGAAFQADNTSIIFASNNIVNNNSTGFLSLANSSAIHLYGNTVQQNSAGFNVTAPSQIFSSQNNSIQTVGNTGSLQNQGVQ
jgi:hypothetical protein